MKWLRILFLFFHRKNIHHKYIHYKKINYNEISGCVEANVTKNIAQQFNATRGNCFNQNCKCYQGSRYIPLIGKVNGYSC